MKWSLILKQSFCESHPIVIILVDRYEKIELRVDLRNVHDMSDCALVTTGNNSILCLPRMPNVSTSDISVLLVDHPFLDVL